MGDPTNDSFREMMLEARIDDAARKRESLSALDEKIDRATARWSEDELRESIALVLADALREAGRTDRDALVRAIAPNILATVRNEVKTSHPEIIEALSPRIGELIRTAVNKAVEDLQRQIDEAMPTDLWIASLRATLTGTPTTGWLLKDDSGFRVIEVFLIERGSGLILAQDRPETSGDEIAALDDDLLGGMIAALDSFAHDAFGNGGGIEELRQLTLSAGTIYLRASPTKILALRCTGVAPPEIEDQIDQLLDRLIRRLQEGGDGDFPARLLAVDIEPQANTPSAATLLGKGAVIACTALFVVWAHFALEGANEDRWADAALTMARDDPAMTGYPVTAEVADDTVTLSGLVPDDETLAGIRDRLARHPIPLDIAIAMPVAGRRLDP